MKAKAIVKKAKPEKRGLLREKIDDPIWLAERLYLMLLRKASEA